MLFRSAAAGIEGRRPESRGGGRNRGGGRTSLRERGPGGRTGCYKSGRRWCRTSRSEARPAFHVLEAADLERLGSSSCLQAGTRLGLWRRGLDYGDRLLEAADLERLGIGVCTSAASSSLPLASRLAVDNNAGTSRPPQRQTRERRGLGKGDEVRKRFFSLGGGIAL